MKENYQRLLDRELERINAEERRPRLLLHACCAPCSSYVLEYLSHYFDITLYYYNPKTAVDKWIFSRTVQTVIGRHSFAV